VRVEGREVAELDPGALREMRRSSIGYVFQDPVAALDPTMRLGRQVALALEAGPIEAAAALEGFGFSNIGRVLAAYPHEVSGGMAQRVTIAMVMRKEPRLIVADEPTASLDAPARAEILEMLVRGCRRLGTGLLLVTHDLQNVEARTERVFVMYGGRIVESGLTRQVLARPRHPYTAALLASAVGRERSGERIEPIPGRPPHLRERSRDCAFAPRCRLAITICRTQRPEPRITNGTVLCHLVDGAPA
jgi:peptide/nickel transport system ATP-binding protein